MPGRDEIYSRKVAIEEITPDAVVERLSYRLARLVGTGRRWSYHAVASGTRIDVRTLKAYVQGTACPNLVKYKRLLAFLGPEIGVDLNAMKGWMPRSDIIPPEALDLEELRIELARAVAVLTEVLGPHHAPAAPARGCDPKPASPTGGSGRTGVTGRSDTDAIFRAALPPERIDGAAVCARLGYRLRKMIGGDGRRSLAEVAEATGIDRRTLQTYVDGAACPNLARYLKLGHFLGPEIGVELAYMIGWEPRYQQPLPLLRDKVELLLGSLQAAEAAVADFGRSAGGEPAPLRLIRPQRGADDLLPEAPRQTHRRASANPPSPVSARAGH